MERVKVRDDADRLRRLLGGILDASSEKIFVFEAVGLRILEANRRACDKLGYADDGLAGRLATDILAGHAADDLRRILAPLLDGSAERLILHTLCRRRDGTTYPVELRLQAVDDQPPTVLAIAGELGGDGRVERALKRVNRAMTALTRATEAMIHAADWQELLDRVCHIVVEVGGYRLAWVGWVRHDEARTIEPVSKCGVAVDYVDKARITWGDEPHGCGPAGTAVRSRQLQVAHDTSVAGSFGPWSEAALRHGLGSMISLPLAVQEQVVGVLNIYAAEADAFDADEVRLLDDLARNLSYGIGALRAEEQRRRAESELKESEERYRALVELSPDAILAHRRGRIVFANAAADRAFRVPEGETLIGRQILDLVHPVDRDAARERVEASIVPAQLVEEKLVRFDGDVFHAEVMVSLVAFHGLDARLVVVRDITDRKQVQDQLVQAAKLATLGEMAAGMAHELSQPLNVIRMSSEGALMLMRRGRATDDYKRKQFQLIADQTRRMAEIIDHIRIFSRKDTGAVEMFDAAEAVRLAIELFERQLRGDNIRVSATYPDAACPVLGRPVQLEQVIMNLLANAADSVRDKRRRPGSDGLQGRLEVVTTCSEDLGLVWIAVSDNGTGIPEKTLDRIFEPFFTTKDVGRGTGLGLSVSFGIVDAMDGRIDACNNKEGASFVVTLPLAACTGSSLGQEPAAAGEQPSAPPRDHHLLVVDDEAEAVEAMAGYLRECGYRVSVAANGVDAWETFQADPAELVITDLRMPKGDGRELIGRLRGRDPLLPIIVVTGEMGMTERLSDELDDELAVVLNKPVSLAFLAETVDQFLQS